MTRAVVALGGNTLLDDGGGVEAQRERIESAADRIAEIGSDREVVLTHGNGPQVGDLLLQQEGAEHPRPLDVLVAETQAQIGYQLQQALAVRFDAPAATVVTRVAVSPDDPALDDPRKPVGPFYTAGEAAERDFETAEVTRPDGTTAHRRVVPSPEPTAVVEAARIERLAWRGPVVCGGGGGVPVVPADEGHRGVEAVVDKDHTSRLLGSALDAAELVFITDVDCAYVHFGGPDQRPIRGITPGELRRHLERGEFEAGSMRPKVEAAVRFVEGGGDRAVIAAPGNVAAALRGEAGTRVRE